MIYLLGYGNHQNNNTTTNATNANTYHNTHNNNNNNYMFHDYNNNNNNINNNINSNNHNNNNQHYDQNNTSSSSSSTSSSSSFHHSHPPLSYGNYNQQQSFGLYYNQMVVERRGAPYSHNVYKYGNIPVAAVPQGKSNISSPRLKEEFNNKIPIKYSTDPLRIATPLNRATAILGDFLTGYYSTLSTNLKKSSSSLSQDQISLPQSLEYSQSKTPTSNYSHENIVFLKNSDKESDRNSPTASINFSNSTLVTSSSSASVSSSSSNSSSNSSSTSPLSSSSSASCSSSSVSIYSKDQRNAVYSD